MLAGRMTPFSTMAYQLATRKLSSNSKDREQLPRLFDPNRTRKSYVLGSSTPYVLGSK